MRPLNIIKVDRKSLFEAAFAASKTTLTTAKCSKCGLPMILSCIVFDVKGQVIDLVATNYYEYMKTSITTLHSTGNGRRFAVIACDLVPVLRLVEGESLTIEAYEYQVVFRHTYGSFTLPLVAENMDFLFKRIGLLEERLTDQSIELEAPFFKSMLNRLKKYIMDDPLRPIMKGICIRRKAGKIDYVASNGYRLVCITKKDEECALCSSLLIPDNVINVLRRIVPNTGFIRLNYSEWKEGITENKNKSVCHISIDNGTDLWFEPTEGKYPDYTKVIPLSFTCTCRIQRKLLLRSLDRMSFLCADSRIIRVEMAENKINLCSKNMDSETEQTETLPCDYKSQPMSFGLSITNVMPVLSSFNCKDVIIQSTGSIRHAFVITPDNQTETETVTALFMPCHVGED